MDFRLNTDYKQGAAQQGLAATSSISQDTFQQKAGSFECRNKKRQA
jgi:hypothetical protein